MNRPTGITILAVLCWIFSAATVVVALVQFTGGAMLANIKKNPAESFLFSLGATGGVIFLAVAVLYTVLGVGLWKLLNWSRILGMILVALGLLSAVWALITALLHSSGYMAIWQAVVCAFDVWILFYFNKPHVKQAFGQQA